MKNPSTSIFFVLIFTLFSSSINASTYVSFSNGYQAWARAAHIGEKIGYAYWNHSGGTKYQRGPNGRYINADSGISYSNAPYLSSLEISNAVDEPTSFGPSVSYNNGIFGKTITYENNNTGLAGGLTRVVTNSDGDTISNNGVSVTVYEQWINVSVSSNTTVDGSFVKLSNLIPNYISILASFSLDNPYIWDTVGNYAGYDTPIHDKITIDGFDLTLFTKDLESGEFNILLSSAIPEPSSYALFIGGLALGLVALRRR